MKSNNEVWQKLSKYEQELFSINWDIKELDKKESLNRIEVESREILIRERDMLKIRIEELKWVLNNQS